MQLLSQIILNPDNFLAINDWIVSHSTIRNTTGIEIKHRKASYFIKYPYILKGFRVFKPDTPTWGDHFDICCITNGGDVEWSTDRINVEEFIKFLYTLDRKRKIEVINGQQENIRE